MSAAAAGQGLLRRVYRRLYWWRSDRRLLRPLAGIRTVVAFGESLGDNLLCTRVLAGLEAAGRGPVAMLTPFPDLFAHFPRPLLCRPYDSGVIAALNRRGPELIMPNYGVYRPDLDRHDPFYPDHMITNLCRSAGLKGTVELKPILVLTPEERAAGHPAATDAVLIQPTGGGALVPMRNKEWSLDRWQACVDALRRDHPVVQIGSRSDRLLQGVTDLRGTLSLRGVAAALDRARLYLGGEGFLMHMARSVDCRAVIVLGGRTTPAQTCYEENHNLFTAVPCAPCGQLNRCQYERVCLTSITVDDVLAAVGAKLSQPKPGPCGQLIRL